MQIDSAATVQEAFQGELIVLRRNTKRVAALVGIYLAVVGLVMACELGLVHIAFRGRPEPFVVAFLIGWPLLAWNSFRVNFDARPKKALIVIDARGVTVDGKLEVPRHRVVEGDHRVRPSPLVSRVRVLGRFALPLIEFQIDCPKKAAQVLRALSLSSGLIPEPGTRFAILSPMRAIVCARAPSLDRWVLIVVSVLLRLSTTRLVPIGVFFAAAALAVAYYLPGRSTIGGDGILVQWLFTRRFIPYSTMSEIECDATTLFVDGKDGSVVSVRVDAQAHPAQDGSAESSLMRSRARLALSRWNRSPQTQRMRPRPLSDYRHSV